MILCRFENGNEASLRHVTVSAVVVNKDSTQVLLAKRALHLPNPGKWCLPGGYLDRDETTEQAALRETFEETGYKTKPLFLFRLIDNPDRPKEDRQNVEFSYVLEAVEKKNSIDSETTEIRWFEIKNLPEENEWAYDHYETVSYYKRWMKEKFGLPVVEK